ncbi:MAG: YrrC family ATP-dependent DNA helicase, partial [Bacteroidota bacterium]
MSFQTSLNTNTGVIQETISGIVDRVTFHNPENGWAILRVCPFNNPHQIETVIVHQMKVFAGATMKFKGAWTYHKQYGRQFKAVEAIEKKAATTAALEKYLGSGLIKGVGPKTAKKIVNHFGENTNEEDPLDVDFLVVDECSMLDISLTAALLKAVPD